MRTIPARLALLVVLATAAPALVMHGQQNPEAMPQAGLVRLLDEDQVAFGSAGQRVAACPARRCCVPG